MNQTLDLIACLVEFPVVPPWVLRVGFGWHDWYALLVADDLPYLLIGIATIHHDPRLLWQRRLLEKLSPRRGIVTVSGGEQERDTAVRAGSDDVNLRRQAATGSAECLRSLFFGAPAADWWALTVVESRKAT